MSSEVTNEIVKKDSKNVKKEVLTLLLNTFIMIVITLVAGGILGTVYVVTKGPIAEMEMQTKQKAYRKVFQSANSFSENIMDSLLITDAVAMEYPGVTISACIEAYDSENNVLGHVIEVTSHEGYGGDIVFMVGVSNDGTVNGISITSISETAGLGMRAEEVLVPQFSNRKAESFAVTKTEITSDNQISAISSATITSKAVTNGVNCALYYFRTVVEGGNVNE